MIVWPVEPCFRAYVTSDLNCLNVLMYSLSLELLILLNLACLSLSKATKESRTIIIAQGRSSQRTPVEILEETRAQRISFESLMRVSQQAIEANPVCLFCGCSDFPEAPQLLHPSSTEHSSFTHPPLFLLKGYCCVNYSVHSIVFLEHCSTCVVNTSSFPILWG